jgi:hypothetical protein
VKVTSLKRTTVFSTRNDLRSAYRASGFAALSWTAQTVRSKQHREPGRSARAAVDQRHTGNTIDAALVRLPEAKLFLSATRATRCSASAEPPSFAIDDGPRFGWAPGTSLRHVR